MFQIKKIYMRTEPTKNHKTRNKDSSELPYAQSTQCTQLSITIKASIVIDLIRSSLLCCHLIITIGQSIDILKTIIVQARIPLVSIVPIKDKTIMAWHMLLLVYTIHIVEFMIIIALHIQQ